MTDAKVLIPLLEYEELIKIRNESAELKQEAEKLRRENFGLKTTVGNLREQIEKSYKRRSWNG